MDPVKKGGLEQLCQWGAADYALMTKAQKSTVDKKKTEEALILQKLDDLNEQLTSEDASKDDMYLDLQDDHIAALRVIMDGMIHRNLSTSEMRKNISVFFSRVECFYSHYCLALNDVSLDDLEIFKF